MTATASPTFSVVITSYNYRDFILEAIDSALAQVPPPLQVVVVDDGSTDGSAELVANRSGVELVRQRNFGQLRAFRAGVERCRGDVVAFLDADDVWKAGYLSALSEAYAGRCEPTTVLSNMTFFGAREGQWRKMASDIDFGLSALSARFLRDYPISPTSGISMRRDLATLALNVPGRVMEAWRTRADECLMMGSCIWGGRTLALARSHVGYRFHGNNRWAGRSYTPIQLSVHYRRLCELSDVYARRARLSRSCLSYAYMEFKTKTAPSWATFLNYVWLQCVADAPLRRRARAIVSIGLHYVRSLFAGSRLTPAREG